MNAKPVIKIDAPGNRGEFVEFKGDGWKFKHLRLWQGTLTAGEKATLISERIQAWRMLDIDGKEIPLEPGPFALDDLSPESSTWLMSTKAYLLAYTKSAEPA